MIRRGGLALVLLALACTSAGERARLRQAQNLVRQKEYGAALAVLEPSRDVRKAPIQYLLGVALLGRNQFPEAAYRFGLATALDAGYRDSVALRYRRKAVELARAADRARAITCLNQAQALKPDLGEEGYLLGDLYRENGEYGLAAQAYEQALRAMPASTARRDAYEGLIECYRQLNDWPRALDAAQRGMNERFYDLAIAYGELAYQQAQEFYRQGQLDSALVSVRRTIEVQRPSMLLDDAYFLLGEIYFVQSNYPAAESAYLNVRRVAPYQRSPFAARADQRLAVIARMKAGP